ncbi:MAG TPA: malate synthase A [Vicinamibacterales bacterium]|jgi:malate synthase|nr:malate synthase A [Vicinamibacterales bacterium]
MSVAPVEQIDRVLTPQAGAFVEELTRRFRPRIEELLARRRDRQQRLDAGERLDFLSDTAGIRNGDWRVAPIPADLQDRRVEITGPVDRKMIINALNSGASVFMADFEDANSPTWPNVIGGQANLMDAIRRTIAFTSEAGKRYALNAKTATLMVRPRGFHLPERHFDVDGRPAPAMLFDFGMFLFHNVGALMKAGTGPYFYLPKMQSHLEARLWNDVFVHAQSALGIPRGTIRATVLIETLPAAFEMDEILHELREHSAGLNCGRWDYIFSSIKTLRRDAGFVMPDRGQVTMEAPFLRAYTQLLIRTCHRRGVHAMGGMAAQIPIKDDPAANERALEKVRADKLREVKEGHDGTWVAHPALVPIAKQVFDEGMSGPNQLGRLRQDVVPDARKLVEPPQGTRTDAGLRHNIRVGIQYLEAWLGGQGAVPIYNLMEDAATAEISRTQIWQWLAHRASLDDGRAVTRDLVARCVDEEYGHVREEVGAARFDRGHFPEARRLFEQVATSTELQEFLTLPAYDTLVNAS